MAELAKISQIMDRPYKHVKSKELLALATGNPDSIALLKEIVSELQERKNDYAFKVLLDVGEMLQAAIDKENMHKNLMKKAGQILQILQHQQGIFEWPTTDAPASRFGFTGDAYFYKNGLLSFVGYKVGYNGENEIIRRGILDSLFHNELPRVDSAEYMNEWGDSETPARLQKLAETLAALTRNAKRNYQADYSKAIEDWEADLDYLYNEYYIGEFHFTWPEL